MPNTVIDGYARMACVACGSFEMDAKISAKGGIYLTCMECRMKIFGLSRTKLARMKYISDLLADDTFRQHWEEAGNEENRRHLESLHKAKEKIHA